MNDTDAFLQHYGKKGMKWGVTTKSPGAQAYSGAKKEQGARLKNQFMKTDSNGQRKVSAGKVAGYSALALVSGGSSITAQYARSAGFSKGKSVAIGLLAGPAAGVVISELKVGKNARKTVKNSGR